MNRQGEALEGQRELRNLRCVDLEGLVSSADVLHRNSPSASLYSLDSLKNDVAGIVA